MKNLNAEQIIKALECCHLSAKDCLTCPYENDNNGCVYLEISALALIKELTEENEKLTINMNAYGLTAKRLGEENERLRDNLDRTEKALITMDKAHNDLFTDTFRIEAEAKADTVRQMHSEIKERCIKGGIYPAFVARMVDQIAEEMLNDENNS